MTRSFGFLGESGGEYPNRGDLPGYHFPESVEPLADLAPVSSVAEAISRSRQGGINILSSMILREYESYARILHPAYRPGVGSPIRWREVASIMERVAHPLMQWAKLFGSNDPDYCPDWLGQPFLGELPSELVKAMLKSLRQFTSTPHRCYLLVWEGYGGIELFYPAAKKVDMPYRRYLVFVGTIDSVQEMADANYLQAPNIWWPEDKAWAVVTDIDLMDTYVGGSAACIKQCRFTGSLNQGFTESLTHPGSVFKRVISGFGRGVNHPLFRPGVSGGATVSLGSWPPR